MEGGGVLAGVQVDEAKIVRDDPLEGVEEEGALEARDRGDEALLAEEAHADVIPQLRRVGCLHGRDAVPGHKKSRRAHTQTDAETQRRRDARVVRRSGHEDVRARRTAQLARVGGMAHT